MRTCFDCIHLLGSWCAEFEESVDSEIFAASDCPAYDEGVR